MIDRFKKLFRPTVDIDAVRAQYADIYATIAEMELSFSKGGPVTWEQLGSYEISTPEKPIGYPTGVNCISYRLPDVGNLRVFYTKCVAPKGERGSFGWHWHPKSRETNIQLEETGKHNGTPLPPFSVTKFEPGTKHDYILPPGGSLITLFEKVVK